MLAAMKRTHWSVWITTALGMLWLAVFPLWHDGSYSRITHAKWEAMVVLTGVAIVGAGLMLTGMASRRELRSRVRLSWIHTAALAYFGLVALSAVFGSWADYHNEAGQLTVLWGARRYEGLITQGYYLLIFLCMSLTRVRVDRLLDAAAASLIIHCVIIGIQYFDVNVFDLFPIGTSMRRNPEFQGTIGNTNMVVGYIALVMPTLLSAFAVMKRPGWLWLPAGLAAVLLVLCIKVDNGIVVLGATIVFLILLALRRPECRWKVLVILGFILLLITFRKLLGLPWFDWKENIVFPRTLKMERLLPGIIGLAVLLLAPVAKRWPGPAMSVRAITALVLVVVVAALAVVYFAPIPQNSFIWQLQEILHGRPQDAFGSERIGIWRVTLEMSRKNLLWGTGPDTFLYAMDHHLWETGQTLTQRFDNPHNLYLGVLSNSGLPAMLLFVTLCGGAAFCAFRRVKKDDAMLPLLLAVVGYLLQGMFTFSICLVTPMFWAMLGMMTAQMNEKIEE